MLGEGGLGLHNRMQDLLSSVNDFLVFVECFLLACTILLAISKFFICVWFSFVLLMFSFCAFNVCLLQVGVGDFRKAVVPANRRCVSG